jgi:hypothetical protein
VLPQPPLAAGEPHPQREHLRVAKPQPIHLGHFGVRPSRSISGSSRDQEQCLRVDSSPGPF